MLKGHDVLIVEQEFLIAIDIQRILEGADARKTTFARSLAEVVKIRDRWSDFNLAIINVSLGDQHAVEICREMAASGMAVVISTADATYRSGIPELEGMPVVVKPFTEDDLLAACSKAIA